MNSRQKDVPANYSLRLQTHRVIHVGLCDFKKQGRAPSKALVLCDSNNLMVRFRVLIGHRSRWEKDAYYSWRVAVIEMLELRLSIISASVKLNAPKSSDFGPVCMNL